MGTSTAEIRVARAVQRRNPIGFAAATWLAEEAEKREDSRRRPATAAEIVEKVRMAFQAIPNHQKQKFFRDPLGYEWSQAAATCNDLARTLWSYSWFLGREGPKDQATLVDLFDELVDGREIREFYRKNNAEFRIPDEKTATDVAAEQCRIIAYSLGKSRNVEYVAGAWAPTGVVKVPGWPAKAARASLHDYVHSQAFFGLVTLSLWMTSAGRDAGRTVGGTAFATDMKGLGGEFFTPGPRKKVRDWLEEGRVTTAFRYVKRCLERPLVRENRAVLGEPNGFDAFGPEIEKDLPRFFEDEPREVFRREPAAWEDLANPENGQPLGVLPKMRFLALRNCLSAENSPGEFAHLSKERSAHGASPAGPFLERWREVVAEGGRLPDTTTEKSRVRGHHPQIQSNHVAWLTGLVDDQLIRFCHEEIQRFAGRVVHLSGKTMDSPSKEAKADIETIASWVNACDGTFGSRKKEFGRTYPALHAFRKAADAVSKSKSLVVRALDASREEYTEPDTGGLPRACRTFTNLVLTKRPTSQDDPDAWGLVLHWRECFRCRLAYAGLVPMLLAERNTWVIPGSTFLNVEMMIDRGDLEDADGDLANLKVRLTRTESRTRKKLLARVSQLLALVESRRTDHAGTWDERETTLRKAAEDLEKIWKKEDRDAELAGIRGGVLKRLWLLGRERTQLPAGEVGPGDATDLLSRALGSYEWGWEESGKGDPYTGVNVAALQFFLGKTTNRPDLLKTSRRNASELYGEMSALLARSEQGSSSDEEEVGGRGRQEIDFWDRATLAELLLLAGNVKEALQRYRALSRSAPHLGGAWLVTARQANLILEFLGDTTRLELQLENPDRA